MEDKSVANRQEMPADLYDSMYAGQMGDAYTGYERPYWDSHYFPLWSRVLREVTKSGAKQVLEVGCGSGSFAHLLFDKSSVEYHGFDFSAEAIAKAGQRTGRAERFSVSNAQDNCLESRTFDTIVCLEVLEHIENDLDVVRSWREGTRCICSVPNFDQPDHVRFFNNEGEVRRRYGDLIAIDRIVRIPRSLVRGRGWKSYLQQLIWSREDPKRLLGLLGYRTFENVAGWIMFSGIRKNSKI